MTVTPFLFQTSGTCDHSHPSDYWTILKYVTPYMYTFLTIPKQGKFYVKCMALTSEILVKFPFWNYSMA